MSSSTRCFPGSSRARRLRNPKPSPRCSPARREREGRVVGRALCRLARWQHAEDGWRRQHRVWRRAGAAGCIGFGWWEKESAYEATVWDLKQAKSAGSVGTNVTGTSAIIGAVVPLPFIARVQSAACNRMADQLRTFFTEGEAPEGAAARRDRIQHRDEEMTRRPFARRKRLVASRCRQRCSAAPRC